MTDDELRDALDGLFAYDTGCVDSGIHDEALRARCVAELAARAARPDHRLWEARLVRDMWVSEEALTNGYGLEDLVGFVQWLADALNYTCADPASADADLWQHHHRRDRRHHMEVMMKVVSARPINLSREPASAEDDLRHKLDVALRILAERERELLELKGPCSNAVCPLHYAHAGPCADRATYPTTRQAELDEVRADETARRNAACLTRAPGY